MKGKSAIVSASKFVQKERACAGKKYKSTQGIAPESVSPPANPWNMNKSRISPSEISQSNATVCASSTCFSMREIILEQQRERDREKETKLKKEATPRAPSHATKPSVAPTPRKNAWRSTTSTTKRWASPKTPRNEESGKKPAEPMSDRNDKPEEKIVRKLSTSPSNHSNSNSGGRGKRMRPKPSSQQNRQKHRSSRRHLQHYSQHQNGNRNSNHGHRDGKFGTPNRNNRRMSIERHDFHSVSKSLSFMSLSSISSGSSCTTPRASSSRILPISERDMIQDLTFPPDVTSEEQSRYVSLDCEMVGAGPHGERSLLARVCVVDWNGKVLLDTFVKPTEAVTDYRTFVSGVRREDMNSETAMEVNECRRAVSELLCGKVLVGHALSNDMAALGLTHPWYDIRDTAMYAPFMAPVQPTVSSVPFTAPPSVAESDCSSTSSSSTSSAPVDTVTPPWETCNMQLRPRKLRELAMTYLGLDIQTPGSEHNPVEDANAALGLYKLARVHWERFIYEIQGVGDTRNFGAPG